LRGPFSTRAEREGILRTGYPGYDTSVGWMAYDDSKVRELTLRAIAQGFQAFKLKVGSEREERDLRRANMLRNFIGDRAALMFDANQHWNLP
jgi:L-fuconate dehydratase